MKDLFPGYYRQSEKDFNKLWKNATFVFDANVLLDLHRFSKNTKKTLIEVIQFLDDKLWIPYRVAYEYHRNLNNAINDQLNNYEETIKRIAELDKCISSSRHPFLDKKNVHSEIKKFCTEKLSQLKNEKKTIEKLIIKNPIKDRLSLLLAGKIGKSFTKEEIEKICGEGDKRYREKTPPGFEDPSKRGVDKFGDLIIWKEILRKAKAEKKDIILVTNDSKQDWYLTHSGKTLGPNPLLINEFIAETSMSFYAYQTKQFLKYYSQHYVKAIGKDVLMEVETDSVILDTYSLTSLVKNIFKEIPSAGSTEPNKNNS